MTSAIQASAPPVPTPGLIASLNARLWLDHTPGDEVFTSLLLSFPAPQFADVDPAEVERTMRGVGASLGVAPRGQGLADVGERLTVHAGGVILLHFDGSRYAMRLPAHPRWAKAISGFGRVLLAVGLDELSPVASRVEIDEYIEAGGETGRLLVGLAMVADSPRTARRAGRDAPAGGRR
ncbi:hypothetical protein [Streptomyces sp. ME19-01-6]|uniref:hypothetical protein n=1 Tax=Streptomyces sp. ME19-01-6 TaxID=3028686 RepID=UPI0029B1A639|nr:hypothetical protein [Streptomyces sp. ME19-01-6]MDX3224392.1 hypothetical protein [Streptomyces sp. ME19-01-6]